MAATVLAIAITRFGTLRNNSPRRRHSRSRLRARHSSVADRLAIRMTTTARRRFGTNSRRALRHPKTVPPTIPASTRRWSARTAPSRTNANPVAVQRSAVPRQQSRHPRPRRAKQHPLTHHRLLRCRVLLRQPTRRRPPRRAWNHSPRPRVPNPRVPNLAPNRVRNPSLIPTPASATVKRVLQSSRS